MYINDICFPNRILDAINDGSLVVFAGAGTSVDAPTSLPNYEELAEEIAEGTGVTFNNDVPCDIFLGRLKANGIPVNELAAKKLSNTCVEHNKVHEAIIDLYPNPEDIKIVTTNYDQMFEHVLKSREIKPVVYNAPALPLGNDIRGIIHVHGNVNEPEYMIVTDEDFGRGYLTEGYVSRFLVKLFETYTVLFIGYSYNDTIMRYLTRAMSRYNVGKKYILTDDDKSDWSVLDIEPILFPVHAYPIMREGLEKLGVSAKKGLLDWKNHFIEISDEPPKDLTMDAEIEYCIENLQRATILSNCVHGNNWIEYLDKKKVFDGCFTTEQEFSDHDFLWANWLCWNFVGKDDDAIFRLLLKHGSITNKNFANILLQKIMRKHDICGDVLAKYIVLLSDFLTNSWMISQLVEMLFEREETHLAIMLFKKFFDCRYVLQDGWGLKGTYEYKHMFLGAYYEISHGWELIGKTLCKNDALELISFVQQKIEEIHYKYVSLNHDSECKEPWELSMLVIENRKEKRFDDDELNILVKIYFESISSIRDNAVFLRSILLQHLNSESALLKKLALRAIRITEAFEPGEALNIILRYNFIGEYFIKEQVFLLIADIFEKISEQEKDNLLDTIEALRQGNENQHRTYEVYNWCVWLQRIDDKNARVNEMISNILSENNFKPREHPECEIESSDVTWVQDISPVSEIELKQKSFSDAARYLNDYNPDPFEGPNRYGLLKVLSSSVSNDYSWAKGIIEELITQKTKDETLWDYVFRGIENSHFLLDKSVELIEYMASFISDCNYDRHLAGFLYDLIRRDDLKNSFKQYEDRLYSVTKIVWKNRSYKQLDFDRVIDATLNTTSGQIILTWITMISYTEELCIPQKYRTSLEQALNLNSWEKSVAVCIIVGHFNFFYFRDKEWTDDNLSVYLMGEDECFSCAWEGMTFFSGRINKDTIDTIIPIYLKAIEHLKLLNREAKLGFIEQLLTLMIYAVDKPTVEFIPKLYKYASVDEIGMFIRAIRNRLADMDENDKTVWWNQWLRHFIDNRKKNKPVPLDEKEKMGILDLLTELDCVFDEAVDVICWNTLPEKIDGVFWCAFDEKQFASRFPHSAVAAIIRILNAASEVEYEDIYIKKIVKELNGLTDREKKQLQEALLSKNIDMTLSI